MTIIEIPAWFVIMLMIMAGIFLLLIAMLGSPWSSAASDQRDKNL